MMIWEGLGDIVNKYRRSVLSLDPLDAVTAPSLLHRLQIPCSYLWYHPFRLSLVIRGLNSC
jgi:hypothetical protein